MTIWIHILVYASVFIVLEMTKQLQQHVIEKKLGKVLVRESNNPLMKNKKKFK